MISRKEKERQTGYPSWKELREQRIWEFQESLWQEVFSGGQEYFPETAGVSRAPVFSSTSSFELAIGL
jgi:hypothetical protein